MMKKEQADLIEELALSCKRFVAQVSQVEPDGTFETLPLLDYYISLLDEEDGSKKEEILSLIAPCMGAYLTEVIQKRWNTRVHVTEDYSEWRVEFQHVFLYFNPIGIVLESIFKDAVPGWSAHFQIQDEDMDIIASALEQNGPVDEEDYYRLSVRMETLEQVVATLEGIKISRSELERQDGIETDPFAELHTAEDYAAFIRDKESTLDTLH